MRQGGIVYPSVRKISDTSCGLIRAARILKKGWNRRVQGRGAMFGHTKLCLLYQSGHVSDVISLLDFETVDFLQDRVVNPAPYPLPGGPGLVESPLTTRKDYVGTILSPPVSPHGCNSLCGET
ncbi:hypothetical protein CDAR_507561 [Caerostris darwini]|uniref:Uncharacterized protein n=1 Tax=Caerostris darwini TaxID=1538125 RepID=A0AAV4MXA9_9ARAC|nr:hypothetical protein CDAR_507561 [Caerostris darwini]